MTIRDGFIIFAGVGGISNLAMTAPLLADRYSNPLLWVAIGVSCISVFLAAMLILEKKP